jgi:hypothetical protein
LTKSRKAGSGWRTRGPMRQIQAPSLVSAERAYEKALLWVARSRFSRVPFTTHAMLPQNASQDTQLPWRDGGVLRLEDGLVCGLDLGDVQFATRFMEKSGGRPCSPWRFFRQLIYTRSFSSSGPSDEGRKAED